MIMSGILKYIFKDGLSITFQISNNQLLVRKLKDFTNI